uniref:Uncharacterized protein n=1 Tax=Rhabditophanes sp. KR3021 TaxID=114890 RepID=A0AC35TKS2_9BILA
MFRSNLNVIFFGLACVSFLKFAECQIILKVEEPSSDANINHYKAQRVHQFHDKYFGPKEKMERRLEEKARLIEEIDDFDTNEPRANVGSFEIESNLNQKKSELKKLTDTLNKRLSKTHKGIR